MKKIEYYVVKILLIITGKISFNAGKRLALVLYFWVAKVFRYRRKVILENLYRVYGNTLPKPEKEMLRAIYLHFVFLWMEFLQIPHLDEDTLEAHFTIHEGHLVEDILQKDGSVILISGHFGNFEWLGQMHALLGHKIYGIAKRLSNPYVDALINEHRKQHGAGVIYKKDAMKEGVRVLNQNSILAIVTDQDAGKRGVYVDFLGMKASTAVGTAVYHLRTGAPVIFIIGVRKDYAKFDIYYQQVLPQSHPEDIDDEKVHAITQQHTQVLENWIRRYPEQWFWMHRRWKTQSLSE